MVSTVNTGSINMPKLMRHLSYRTNNVREVVFQRDAIFNKATKTTGATTGTEGSGTSLSGPAVNFGYESSTNTTIDGSASDTVYHVSSPELLIGGLRVLQTPVISRSGKLERTGARISGECKFYTPSLATIRQLDNFSETNQFDEFEAYDKFIDMERVIQNPADVTKGDVLNVTNGASIATFSDSTPGYEIDRLQITCSLGGTGNTSEDITEVSIGGNISGSEAYLKWAGSAQMNTTAAGNPTIVDLPVRNISTGDTVQVWENGNNYTYTATVSNNFDIDKLIGDSNNELSYIKVKSGNYDNFIFKNIYLYKEAQWSIESIKDYRDEYMQIKAVRIRGDRTSRRRTHG